MTPRSDYADTLDSLRILAQRDLLAWWNRAKFTPTGYIRDRDLLKAPFIAIVQAYGEQAALAAADYLFLSRSYDETLRELEYPEQAEPASYEQAESAFRYATAVPDIKNITRTDIAAVLGKLQSITNRLVAAPGHRTVEMAVARAGSRYARVPEPGACTWCLMLASRGAVYSKETVVKNLDRYHDGCRCVGIEVKEDMSDLPQINKDLEKLWKRNPSEEGFKRTIQDKREELELERLAKMVTLSESQRKAVARWQGMDRFYAKVQKAAGGKLTDDPEAEEALNELAASAEEMPLARDMNLWRGLRNAHLAFETDDLDSIVGQSFPQERFTAVSTDRDIAVAFTSPGKHPAILDVTVRQGTTGIWMPVHGLQAPELAEQQELLIPPGARMTVTGITRRGDDPPIMKVVIDRAD